MTDLDDAVDELGVARFVPGAAQATLRELDDSLNGVGGRTAMWIEFDSGEEPARLTAATGQQLDAGMPSPSTSVSRSSSRSRRAAPTSRRAWTPSRAGVASPDV